ncbi:MAG TPA: damage-control phosphatase ARMT1 family protein, partial [Anaerolineales bacterium]
MNAELKPTSPKPPIPEPLRGAEIGTFAHSSVVVRLPDIGRRIFAENDFPNEIMGKLEALIGEIPYGQICPLNDPGAPDLGAWTRYIEPYLGQNWLQVPWFFAETYFYRRVLEASRYFQPGQGQGVDPYAAQKRRGLETGARTFPLAPSQVLLGRSREGPGDREDRLIQRLRTNLWGNQADLSLWPADEDQKPGQSEDRVREDRILVDHSVQVAAYLDESRAQPGRVDFIMDNAGLELVNDLALADYLLAGGFARGVRLHLKSHPTFVSDAMIKDVREAIAHLYASADDEVRAFGKRLEKHWRAGRLHLVEDFFWTSPLAFWQLPAHLQQELAGADLIISKGDANYRRLLGDRHWPFTIPAADVLRYAP